MTTRDEVARPKLSIAAMRQAVADYMASEGCSCCENTDAHEKHKGVLAKLLKVPKYDDNSGYNFYSFRTKEK